MSQSTDVPRKAKTRRPGVCMGVSETYAWNPQGRERYLAVQKVAGWLTLCHWHLINIPDNAENFFSGGNIPVHPNTSALLSLILK